VCEEEEEAESIAMVDESEDEAERGALEVKAFWPDDDCCA
jgi:hypothetical protein